MNRNERRSNERQKEKFRHDVSILTPAQMNLVGILATKRAEDALEEIHKIVNECFLQAMRYYKISEERAGKVLSMADILIVQRSTEEEKASNG